MGRDVDHSNKKESDWTIKERGWYLCNDSSIQRERKHPGQKWKNFLNQKEASKASFPKKNGHYRQSKQMYFFFVQVFFLYTLAKGSLNLSHSQKEIHVKFIKISPMLEIYSKKITVDLP